MYAVDNGLAVIPASKGKSESNSGSVPLGHQGDNSVSVPRSRISQISRWEKVVPPDRVWWNIRRGTPSR